MSILYCNSNAINFMIIILNVYFISLPNNYSEFYILIEMHSNLSSKKGLKPKKISLKQFK